MKGKFLAPMLTGFKRFATMLAPRGMMDPEAPSGRNWSLFVLAMGICLILAASSVIIVIVLAVTGSAPVGGQLLLLVATVVVAIVALFTAFTFANLASAAAQRENPQRVSQAVRQQRWARTRDDRGRLTQLGWSVVVAVAGLIGLVIWELLHP